MDYDILKGYEQMKPEQIKLLLEQTYWANERTMDTLLKAMKHSVCYGVFEKESGRQVGFARVVTDFAVVYYLADVIIDSDHRGKGLGKMLVEKIVTDPDYEGLRGILFTRDAHGLYAKYGYIEAGSRFMTKTPK